MNLSTMRTHVRRILNEEGESDGFYSDDEINDYLNEAYKELVRIFPTDRLASEMNELIGSQSYSSDDGIEDLPSDYDRPIYVKYGSYYCTIIPSEGQSLVDDDPWYEAVAVEPIAYMNDGDLYVKPAPSSTTTIVLKYMEIPTELSADTDSPAIKTIYHEMICMGAAERCKVKDNEFDEASYHFSRMKKAMYAYLNRLTPEEQLRR